MIEPFNIFNILSKDDKELVHSAFIKFLLSENNSLYEILFNLPNLVFNEPILEKSYGLKNEKGKKIGKRVRFDIEIMDHEFKNIVVIENKFKSFPNREQLTRYDQVIEQNHKSKNVHKFLFCFDKSLISFKTDWTLFDYRELLTHINKFYATNTCSDKKFAIHQYYSFLDRFYHRYELLKNDTSELFYEDSKDKNFWLRLILSALLLKLQDAFDKQKIDLSLYLDNGDTSKPLLNICPKHWKVKGNELVIQFQGNDIKFYSHTNNRTFINEVIQLSKDKFKSSVFKYKSFTKTDSKTNYILKEDITQMIDSDKAISLPEILDILIQFYYEIDREIVQDYNNR